MISFPKLGNYGRLGNQLFQYAFLRATAQRLGVQFYCPTWDGDSIFSLDDGNERAATPLNILHFYDQAPEAGYTSSALEIRDGTEIQGYFQSEKYYPDPGKVRSWYTFRPEIIQASQAYAKFTDQGCASISLRLDDDYSATRVFLPLYPVSYYESALNLTATTAPTLVLADRIDRAKEFLRPLRGREFIFVEGLSGPEQIYLMTQCRTNIVTNSTFAWWGAWLNSTINRKVVAAREWCRPGIPIQIEGILCDDWILLNGTRWGWDHFQVWRMRHPISTVRRVWSKLGWHSAK